VQYKSNLFYALCSVAVMCFNLDIIFIIDCCQKGTYYCDVWLVLSFDSVYMLIVHSSSCNLALIVLSPSIQSFKVGSKVSLLNTVFITVFFSVHCAVV